MIMITDGLWVGDSGDERMIGASDVHVVLCVAQDLKATWGWGDGVEYMQVGLVDGPGNTLAAYYAAVLALVELRKHGDVLVFCHSGGRALAVAMMYLNIQGNRSWSGWMELLRERIDGPMPATHEAHIEAFNKLDRELLKKVVGK